MVKKAVIIFFPIYLYSQDLDLDGVEDEFDRCLNTAFTSIVGKDGCDIETLKKEWRLDFRYGNTFYEDELSHFGMVNYSYKNITFGSSIYKDEVNYLASYNFNYQDIFLSLTGETAFKGEYSISSDLTYRISDSFSIFGGYIYNSFKIEQINSLENQNETIFGGFSKNIQKHNISAIYSNSSQIEKSLKNSEYLSISYSLDISEFSFSFSITSSSC